MRPSSPRLPISALYPPGFMMMLPLAIILVGADDCTEPPDDTPTPMTTPAPGGEVHGQAMADLEEGDEARPVFIPDLTVRLIDEASGGEQHTQTDGHGRFRFPFQPNGTYQLCWEGEGWDGACQAEAVVINSAPAYPPVIEATPGGLVAKTTGSLTSLTLSGDVGLVDGGSCWVEAPFFSVYQNAEITLLNLLDGLPLVPSVRANSDGRFVLPNVPVVAGLLVSLQAQCGGGLAQVVLELGDLLPLRAESAQRYEAVNLSVENHQPAVRALYAEYEDRVVSVAPPGAELSLTAELADDDGDSLALTWRLEEASGAITPGPDGTATWTLPMNEGLATARLLVDDGHGGVTPASIDVAVTARSQVSFSGAALDPAGDVLTQASVWIGGEAIPVNETGGFAAEVEAASSFAVTMAAPDHAPWTETFTGRVTDLRWRLPQAFLFTADPTADINLSVGGGPVAGMAVHIPAGSLVDANGEPPEGDVRLSLAALDPTLDGLPGGYHGRQADGSDTRFTALGSASVRITSPDGAAAYNLASGEHATLRFTPPAALVSAMTLPAAAPVWLLDEASGRWQEEGEAALEGDTYVYDAPHFSMRTVAMAEGASACVRVHIDSSLKLPLQVLVEVPTSPSTSQLHRLTFTDDLNAILDLPPNQVIDVVPLSRRGEPIEIGRQVINTGDAVDGAEAQRAHSPYAACAGEVTLSAIPEPSGFGNGWMWLTAEGRPDPGEEAAQTRAYYNTIDPTGARQTLGGWWQANGFDPQTGEGGQRATFYNANELAYWRDMRCRQDDSTGDIACYVAKYQDGGAAIAGDVAFTGETVAMEWRALQAGRPRTVTFAAYAGGGRDAQRVEYADFDGMGNRYLPYVCANCHGGTYDPVDKNNPTLREAEMGANFLMFDLDLFGFSDLAPRESQEGAFYTLNHLVAGTRPPQAVTELIDGWYADEGRVFDGSWAPPTYRESPQSDLYQSFIQPSCRSCHVSQANLEWNVYRDGNDATTSDVAQPRMRRFIRLLVCGTNHMPHSRPSYTRFWTSENPNSPQFLANYQDLSVGWTPFEDCE